MERFFYLYIESIVWGRRRPDRNLGDDATHVFIIYHYYEPQSTTRDIYICTMYSIWEPQFDQAGESAVLKPRFRSKGRHFEFRCGSFDVYFFHSPNFDLSPWKIEFFNSVKLKSDYTAVTKRLFNVCILYAYTHICQIGSLCKSMK